LLCRVSICTLARMVQGAGGDSPQESGDAPLRGASWFVLCADVAPASTGRKRLGLMSFLLIPLCQGGRLSEAPSLFLAKGRGSYRLSFPKRKSQGLLLKVETHVVARAGVGQ